MRTEGERGSAGDAKSGLAMRASRKRLKWWGDIFNGFIFIRRPSIFGFKIGITLFRILEMFGVKLFRLLDIPLDKIRDLHCEKGSFLILTTYGFKPIQETLGSLTCYWVLLDGFTAVHRDKAP